MCSQAQPVTEPRSSSKYSSPLIRPQRFTCVHQAAKLWRILSCPQPAQRQPWGALVEVRHHLAPCCLGSEATEDCPWGSQRHCLIPLVPALPLPAARCAPRSCSFPFKALGHLPIFSPSLWTSAWLLQPHHEHVAHFPPFFLSFLHSLLMKFSGICPSIWVT